MSYLRTRIAAIMSIYVGYGWSNAHPYIIPDERIDAPWYAGRHDRGTRSNSNPPRATWSVRHIPPAVRQVRRQARPRWVRGIRKAVRQLLST